MLRFASPLPRNYRDIVRIYTEPVEVVEEKCPPMTRDVDPWIDPSLLIKSLDVVAPIVKPVEEVKPIEQVKIPPPQDTTPLIMSPFVMKPVITTMMNETELKHANPSLDEKYIEQRDQMIKNRETLKNEVFDIKDDQLDIKTDIPEDFIEKQKKLFEDQQAALRALRNTSTVSEAKQKVDVEQPLPPPNVNEPVQALSAQPQGLGNGKQLADVILVPPINLIHNVESLRVDQLKQLCAKRGLMTKGLKAELIVRLKEAGVLSITL